MSQRLLGKVALISGASGSLGAVIAKRFAEEGAILCLADLDIGKLAHQRECLSIQNESYLAVQLDVRAEASWRRVVSEIQERFGRLDILVNNAGVALPKKSLEDRTEEEWERIMSVNLRGVFLGAKCVLAMMRAQGGGSIVNVASLAGLGQSGIMDIAYAASKGGVRILTRIIAAQHAHEGIRCNAVYPGPINSTLAAAIWADENARAHRLSRIPAGRFAEPEEVANAILFAASDESRYMNGAEISVDGAATSQ